MNKILTFAGSVLMGAAVLTSCVDDRDSNPVIDVTDATIELYAPSYNNEIIDLVNSQSIHFAWSEPEVAHAASGKPAPIAKKGGTIYALEVSLTGEFTTPLDAELSDECGATVADYAVLDETGNLCSADVATLGLNKMLSQVGHWDDEAYPEVATAYVRVKAEFEGFNKKTNEGITIISNVQEIIVHPSYVLEEAAPIEFWYLVGNCIADGSWGDKNGESALKMLPVKGEEYDFKTGKGTIEWIGYINDGFKLRGDLTDGWATQWGQGASFGEFVKNDGGSGNIQPTEEGYYRVTLNTLTDELKVEPYEGVKEYAEGLAVAGTFNDWGDTPMVAVHTKCTAVQNHDWYYDLNVSNPEGEKFKFKLVGTWDTNWGGPSEFTGWGVSGGDDIWVPAGNYRIFFNDITGCYEIQAK